LIPPLAGRLFTPAGAATVLVALVALLHLLVAGRFELSGDEAHYALYAYHLDWSYFDHPPMVGWLLATLLPISDSEFVLRLWPVMLSVLSSWLLFQLTQRLYPDSSPWVATVAVALLHSAIIYQLLSMAMVPDSPLVPVGLALALLLHRAVIEGKTMSWLAIGVMFGLAGLSKYTAVLLVFGTALIVLQGQWRQLLTPWLWGGVVIAMVVISPVLWWNLQHDWISISYQLGHGMPERNWSLQRVGLSLLGQFLAYGPLLVVAAVMATLSGINNSRHRFTLFLAWPLLLFFGWNSGYEPSLPHWTLIGWALLLPTAAYWLVTRWANLSVRILAWGGGGYSVVLVLLVHSSLFTPWLPFEDERYPLADLYGWEQAADRALELAAANGVEGSEPLPLYAGNWSFASHIAWYARPAQVKVSDDKYTQNDIWFGSPVVGESAILVVPYQFRNEPQSNGTQRFKQCELRESVPVIFRQRTATSYQLYLCREYLG